MTQREQYENNPDITIVTGACPHDCPDTCTWQVAVDQRSGRAIDLWGAPDHPITRGRLCAKVDPYLERVYHARRLTRPMRRVGPKGSGRFEPIGWDEAIGEIGEKLSRVIEEHGAEAVLPYSYAGTMGLLQGEGMAAPFFHKMGASRLARTICSEAGFEGYRYTIGASQGLATEHFADARLILLWGTNTLTSNQHLWPFVQQARKEGARVIVIDPARTRTARAADEWIPIRPGTDGALALAIMHVIVDEGLEDADYIGRYTTGYEALRDRVARWTPERVESITGIPAVRIRLLAREYARTRPAAIRINYGLQRHYGGGMAVRNIACLPALVGAWREVGGGIQLSTSGDFRFDLTGLWRPDLLEGRDPRTINMNRLGDALSTDLALVAQAHHAPRPVDVKPEPNNAGPLVKALIVYNSNPASVAPDQSAVLDGLRREDLLTVVLEHFQTDTADYADYVLPATTQMEHWDLQKVYGHPYLPLNRPAIEPVGEALPNSEIFRRLAAALGYDDPVFRKGDEEILRDLIESQRGAQFDGITWEALCERGWMPLNLPRKSLPFAEGDFPTPSGRTEFYSERMLADGYDPLPTFTPPASMESEEGRTTLERETLVCISPPAHSFLNSTFVNVERLRRREGEPLLLIHPQDADVRQIADGDRVRIHNERGEVELVARVSAEIVAGTVLAPGIWWSSLAPDGRGINQVTPQDETDMGGGALFYDARVNVELILDADGEKRPEMASPLAVG